MKCYNCGNMFTLFNGCLELPSDILGSFTINNIPYFKCTNCGEIFLSDEAWNVADQTENKLITEFISNLSLNKFVGASKAALILGMSRQALHKHRRIRRGFIYSIMHEGKRLYHIDSVKLFKKTGDGRFPLKKEPNRTKKEYVIVNIPYSLTVSNFREYGGEEKIVSWSSNQTITPFFNG